MGRVDRVEEAPPPVLLDALPRDRAQRRGILHGAAVGLADPHRGAGRLDQPLVAGQGPLPLRGQGVDLAAGAGGGGDVDDDETDADDLPVRRADGIGVEPPLLQRAPAVPEPAAHGNVEPGPAVGEHLAQPGGDLGADRSVHRLQRPAEAFLDGAAVGVEDRPVDPAVAQFGVEERQTHRSGLPQSVEQGERLVARAGVVDLLQHPDQQRALGVGQRLGAEVQRGVGLHIGGDAAAEGASGEQLVADAPGGRGVERQSAETVADDAGTVPAGEAFGAGVPEEDLTVAREREHPERQMLDHPGQQVVGLHRPPRTGRRRRPAIVESSRRHGPAPPARRGRSVIDP